MLLVVVVLRQILLVMEIVPNLVVEAVDQEVMEVAEEVDHQFLQQVVAELGEV
jgi:hypothetical protein